MEKSELEKELKETRMALALETSEVRNRDKSYHELQKKYLEAFELLLKCREDLCFWNSPLVKEIDKLTHRASAGNGA